jgi:ribonuclease P protein component
MRLPSSLHLKQAKDFAALRAQGRSHAGRYCVLSVLAVPQLSEFRFGLITSRKVGGAVVRNRLRRQLREVIRSFRGEILPGHHFVTIVRWSAPGRSLEELRKDWRHCASKLGLLVKPNKALPS